MRSWAKFIPLGVLLVIAALVLRANIPGTPLDRALKQALPTPEQVRGFRIVTPAQPQLLSESGGRASIHLARDADDLSVSIIVGIAEDETEARSLSAISIDTPAGSMQPGCPTKRRIGQEVWQYRYRDGGPPRGGFRLITRDGRSLVMVQLMFTGKQKGKDRPWERPVKREDLQMAEDLAIGCLDRLTKMGYTSRSGR